jgi:hypothetical protein
MDAIDAWKGRVMTTQEAEIARLQAELADMGLSWANDARRDAEEIARLREALEPLVKYQKATPEEIERARAALAPRPEGKGE